MLFSTAVAADPAPTPAEETSSALSGAFPMLLMIVVIYFLLYRPHQKRIRDHDGMVKSLRRGDKVVTAGGVIGVISRIEDDILVLEVAENVKIRVLRDTISSVMNKTVANDNKADNKSTGK